MMKIAFPTNRLITISLGYEHYRHAGRKTFRIGTIAQPRWCPSPRWGGKIGIGYVIKHHGKAGGALPMKYRFQRGPGTTAVDPSCFLFFVIGVEIAILNGKTYSGVHKNTGPIKNSHIKPP